MKILVLNAGSSSIKYRLFDMPRATVLGRGLAERIGQSDAVLHYRAKGSPVVITQAIPEPERGYTSALRAIIAMLTDKKVGCIKAVMDVEAVGHRVVHGGEDFTQTTRITPEVKEAIRRLFTLAPLHNPANLEGIETAELLFPHAEQVAVFDTAFHQTMPPVAYRMALPDRVYRDEGIRAFGFHGISHQFVAAEAKRLMKRKTDRMITVHLGNGCSMAAIKEGVVVDTSMGLGPLGGLVMGTRAGDVDPSALLHLMRQCGYSPDDMYTMLNKESGLLGLSGHSDMRDVKKAMLSGDPKAQLAYDIYAYRIQKYIGAFVAVLGGLDALVFTAGVGENDALLRHMVCERLHCFSVDIDVMRNSKKVQKPLVISSSKSKVRVMMIPTNEELEIARQAAHLLGVRTHYSKNG